MSKKIRYSIVKRTDPFKLMCTVQYDHTGTTYLRRMSHLVRYIWQQYAK